MNRGAVIRATLVVSLAFNIAIVMMAAGHFLHLHPHDPMMSPETMMDRMTRHMSEADANIVRQEFGSRQAALMNGAEERKIAFEKVHQVLAADTLDPAALKSAMDNAHSVMESNGDVMESIMLETAGKLSPQGRAEMLPPPPKN